MEDEIKRLIEDENVLNMEKQVIGEKFDFQRDISKKASEGANLNDSDKICIRLNIDCLNNEEKAFLASINSRLCEIKYQKEILDLQDKVSIASDEEKNDLVNDIENKKAEAELSKLENRLRVLRTEIDRAWSYSSLYEYQINAGVIFGKEVDKEYLKSLIDYYNKYIASKNNEFVEIKIMYNDLFGKMYPNALPDNMIL